MSARKRVEIWKSFVKKEPKEKDVEQMTEKEKKKLEKQKIKMESKFESLQTQMENPTTKQNDGQRELFPDSLDSVEADQSKIKSLNDQLFSMTNEADNGRILETGQYEIYEKRKQQEKVQKEANVLASLQRRKRLIQKETAHENGKNDVIVNDFAAPMELETVPNLQTHTSLPVTNLDEHHYSGNETDLFLLKVQKQKHSTSDDVSARISLTRRQVLSYIAQYKDEALYYDHYVKSVVDTEGIDFQKMEVTSVSYNRQYMREANPNVPHEIPCMNLDHDPVQGEIGIRCESHRLSAEWLGPNKAFKCRQFLLPSRDAQIAAAVKHNRRVAEQKKRSLRLGEKELQMVDPCEWLPKVPEMCILCYFKFVNRCYFGELFNDVERNNSDLTKDMAQEQENMNNNDSIYHKFMVEVGPGGYDLRYTLTGDRSPHGICGPFPLYMESCYSPRKMSSGLWCFDESDELHFRLGRDPPLALPKGSPQRSMEGTNTYSQ